MTKEVHWHSTYVFQRAYELRRFKIRMSQRRDDGLTGRFGGGYNWSIAAELSSRTLHLCLLVIEISIYLKPKGK